jgi:hypothetical protein
MRNHVAVNKVKEILLEWPHHVSQAIYLQRRCEHIELERLSRHTDSKPILLLEKMIKITFGCAGQTLKLNSTL